jgi:hypothetical protein
MACARTWIIQTAFLLLFWGCRRQWWAPCRSNFEKMVQPSNRKDDPRTFKVHIFVTKMSHTLTPKWNLLSFKIQLLWKHIFSPYWMPINKSRFLNRTFLLFSTLLPFHTTYLWPTFVCLLEIENIKNGTIPVH